jgi:hypothetical protein
MIEIPNFVEEAIEGGIDVTIQHHDCYGYQLDMNLEAKSHLYIVKDCDAWYALMRYDERHQISDVEELKWAARHGMHGREYINAKWAEFLLSDEERAERALALTAFDKLSVEEQNAIKKFFA